MSNSITEGKAQLRDPDADGVLKQLPTTAREELRAQVMAASAAIEAGDAQRGRGISTIQSRTDLLQATVAGAEKGELREPKDDLTKRWAELDAAEFARLRSPTKRDAALGLIATNARLSPEYRDDLATVSPTLAEAANLVNKVIATEESRVQRQRENEALQEQRVAGFDAASLRMVATARAAQAADASRAMGITDDKAESTADRQPAAAKPPVSSQADRDGKAGPIPQHEPTAPTGAAVRDASSRADDDAAASARTIKRPIQEAEVPEEVRRAFLVTTEGAGLIDRGRTEFSYKGGARDGQLAFADAGKSLTTQGQDRDVIRSMVAIAETKNWKEITVTGTDDFKRMAWLEGRAAGLEVNGYEPREADKRALAELLAVREKDAGRNGNAISMGGREMARDPDEGRGKAAAGSDVEELRKTLTQRFQGNQDVAPGVQDKARDPVKGPVVEQGGREVDLIKGMNRDELQALNRAMTAPAGEKNEAVHRVFEESAARRGANVDRVSPREDQPSHRHIDGDKLTASEKATLDAARTYMTQKYEKPFADAVLSDLEGRIRAQRVHLGELVEHGSAPYRHDSKNDPSYYVTLRTAQGTETVWGKQLGDALRDGGARHGDQIVLTNTGKKPVDVQQTVTGEGGREETIWKRADLNSWTAQPIDRLTERGTSTAGQPTLLVADPAAERVRRADEKTHTPAGRDERQRLLDVDRAQDR